MTRKAARATLVLGIHREELGRELRQRAACRGRAAGSVLVEIEAKFAVATFAWRFVGATIQNGLTCWELWFHRRVRASLRCASGHLDSARNSVESAISPKPLENRSQSQPALFDREGDEDGGGEASATTALASRSRGIKVHAHLQVNSDARFTVLQFFDANDLGDILAVQRIVRGRIGKGDEHAHAWIVGVQAGGEIDAAL